MAEEHPCQAPEGHRLCVNNCGFFGSSATMNLCSKCFREQESAKSTIENALSTATATATSSVAAFPSPSPSTSSSPAPTPAAVESFVPQPVELEASSSVTVSVTTSSNPGAPIQPNRCATCRKRVGLTGFKCRCGVTFCGAHRYPEKHACAFDFKTVGREEIARANPVIKAEKLDRI
ncbi:zinc finger A20 and AN1 domain-containing stress-associated protein 4 [Arachis duranensis]|uniref:Zinc finger A20 and AN1 domain-containing stress-associated protein 4 n=1 Tax=Arachis duranensis TaxID=130453 RepID=A0A6P4CH34_ARADU|nr:zinc finger A20 and AN1 domain-containing stress-associated protein 4 [Arachis duranensis]